MKHEWRFSNRTHTAKTVEEARQALGRLATRILRGAGFPRTVRCPSSGRRRQIYISVHFKRPGDTQ